MANGWELSQTHHGDFEQKARVNGDWPVRLLAMASPDQRAYAYLQMPQSLEVVTAGFYELDSDRVVADTSTAALRCRLRVGVSIPLLTNQVRVVDAFPNSDSAAGFAFSKARVRDGDARGIQAAIAAMRADGTLLRITYLRQAAAVSSMS